MSARESTAGIPEIARGPRPTRGHGCPRSWHLGNTPSRCAPSESRSALRFAARHGYIGHEILSSLVGDPGLARSRHRDRLQKPFSFPIHFSPRDGTSRRCPDPSATRKRVCPEGHRRSEKHGSDEGRTTDSTPGPHPHRRRWKVRRGQRASPRFFSNRRMVLGDALFRARRLSGPRRLVFIVPVDQYANG